jgi:hypothetical protein
VLLTLRNVLARRSSCSNSPCRHRCRGGVRSAGITDTEWQPGGYRQVAREAPAIPKDAAAASAFVVRSDREPFGIGRDSYDFSHPKPGWALERVQLQTYPKCRSHKWLEADADVKSNRLYAWETNEADLLTVAKLRLSRNSQPIRLSIVYFP